MYIVFEFTNLLQFITVRMTFFLPISLNLKNNHLSTKSTDLIPFDFLRSFFLSWIMIPMKCDYPFFLIFHTIWIQCITNEGSSSIRKGISEFLFSFSYITRHIFQRIQTFPSDFHLYCLRCPSFALCKFSGIIFCLGAERIQLKD